MIRILSRLLTLTAMAVVVAALPVQAAEDLPVEGETPIVIHALSLERDIAEGVVVGEGAVDILYGEMSLKADRVVLNEKTKLLIADGNVLLEEGESRLQGEHMELNLDTRTGFVEEGFGFAETYYFSGERIEKVGRSQYRSLNGSFTTCEGTVPDWRFKSPEAFLQVDDYVKAKHPSMWVRRAPVLYLPYAAFPLGKERASGLLIPELRVNQVDGWIVGNALYWAPVDNFDATVGLDWYQNLGWSPNLEIRYITAPGTYGTFNAHYLNEKDIDLQSWMVSFDHLHALPYGIRGQADIYAQSDRNTARRFADTLEDQAMEKTSSYVALSRSWSYYDVVLSARYEESLVSEEESTIKRLPELTVDRTHSRIGETSFFWSLAFEAVHLESDDVEEVFTVPGLEGDQVLLADQNVVKTNRVDILPEVSWPWTPVSWGSLTPTFSFRATHYSEDLEGESATRMLPTFDLAAEGPRFYRIFEREGKGVEKIKHLIEPRISWIYIPDEEQFNLPQFDSVDFIPPLNSLVYSLTNTVLGKENPSTEGAPVRTRELLRFKLSQSYDLDAEEVAGESRPFSDASWDVTSAPTRSWDLRWRGLYDVYESEVSFQDISATWTSSGGIKLRGEWWTRTSGENDFLDLWAQVPVGRWDLEARSRYNIGQEEYVENKVGVKYTSQCWDITVGYVQWPDEYEYRFQLGLKGIGTVLNLWSGDSTP